MTQHNGEAICDDCQTKIIWQSLQSYYLQVEAHGLNRCTPAQESFDTMALDIKCAYCIFFFAGWDEVATHVKTCIGKPKYVTWQKALSQCFINYKNQHTKENEEMSPMPAAGAPEQQGGSDRSRGKKKGEGPPWLNNEHLAGTNKREPKRAKITAVRLEKSKFNDCVLKISIGGQPFFWGQKVFYETYKAMLAQFGSDENNWIGKDVYIYTELDEFTEKPFQHVDFPDAAQKRARA